MEESQNSVTNMETELTMCDVLQEEKELEEDANAVLGGSDDKNCSYDQGYVPRQALYACTSCSTNGDAGICLACCYACHDGHDVVELYTKRNFRCDCGNSKFGENKCKLNPSKTAENTKNRYNQNFRGVYCTCSRPYPDLEDDIPDEMIQCIFCEDWYHGRHLDADVPDDYYEMICGKCMESHPFLFTYLNRYEVKVDVESITSPEQNSLHLSDIKLETSDIKNESGDVSKVESVVKMEENTVTEVSGSKTACDEPIKSSPKENIKTEIKEESNGSSLSTSEMIVPKVEVTGEKCVLKELENNTGRTKGAAFWPENWRKELCRCSTCLDMYSQVDCEFLLNQEDTIQAYEAKGKSEEGDESQYDKGLSALSKLDRVKQMEAVRAYTSMKGQLKEYLKEFAENKRTVRECDIKEFFEQMKKKQKLNNGVPHFCR